MYFNALKNYIQLKLRCKEITRIHKEKEKMIVLGTNLEGGGCGRVYKSELQA